MSDMTSDAYQLVDVLNPDIMMMFALMYSKIKSHKYLNAILFLNIFLLGYWMLNLIRWLVQYTCDTVCKKVDGFIMKIMIEKHRKNPVCEYITAIRV